MKKTIMLLLLCLGCAKSDPNVVYLSENGMFLHGIHELKALSSASEVKGSVNGSYFVFIGGFSGDMRTENVVKFLWKNNNDEYVPTILPYNKTRFVISETEGPSVKFKWHQHTMRDPTDAILYAVFTVKESQIASDINFDLKDK